MPLECALCCALFLVVVLKGIWFESVLVPIADVLCAYGSAGIGEAFVPITTVWSTTKLPSGNGSCLTPRPKTFSAPEQRFPLNTLPLLFSHALAVWRWSVL